MLAPETVDLEVLSDRRARGEPVWLDLRDPDDEERSVTWRVLADPAAGPGGLASLFLTGRASGDRALIMIKFVVRP